MKLEYIELEDFRQFYGIQTADFSISPDLNVTVFHGVNGAGKTSLFSAINWCLYDAGVEDIGELVSKEALSNTDDGERAQTRVAVIFLHQGNRYIAKRVLTVRKSEHGEAKPLDTEFTLTRIRASGDAEDISNPVGYVNAILPANVRPYFFFDGEKMDDLTRADNKEVEEAIRNVMRLPALERAERHLKSIAGEYRREIGKQGSPELEKLISQEERLRAEKDKALERQEELKDEIRLARQHIDDLKAKLREIEDTRDLQKQRDNIEDLLETLDGQAERQLQSIQRVANQSYIKLMTQPLQQALIVLDEKRERGEIPSGIREQFVKDLLDNSECICGRPFQENDPVHERLTSLLNRTSSSELESEVLRLAGNLRALSSIVSSQASSLDSSVSDHVETQSRMDRLYRRLDDIKRQLESAPKEEIAGLEKRRSDFQRKLEMALGERGSIENQIQSLDQQIEETIKDKREAEAKEEKLSLLTRKEEFAQKAADAVTRIKQEFFEHTRREIEAATKEVFHKLAWKQEHFQDVRLDSDFRLEVIDRWGTPTRQELSAGERQILSLAFICAMVKVSGEEAPMVMDTPFGRLSGNHLTAVAENLPDLTSQLVLFVTDREWDEASRTNLEPQAGAQYELQFDPKSGCTDIAEVAW